ncbi:MAG TPA: S8 family peptidase [Blastocatellia bacterium]|nr:S8 family peptidase [Blastocatellia bacterium]
MKRFAGVLFFLALLLSFFIPVPRAVTKADSKGRPLYVEGQVIVKTRAEAGVGVDALQAAEMLLPARAAAAETISSNEVGDTYLLQLEGGVSVEDAIAELSANPSVEYVEPNYLIYPQSTTPNDTYFYEQWGLFNNSRPGSDIGATRVWDITQGSQDVVVAVVDTGADLSHPDLAANAWVNPGEVEGNGVDDDRNGFVDDVNGWNFRNNNNRLIRDTEEDYHGTHVAGIIGASGNNGAGISGVAWRVKLMSLKFIGNESGSTVDAAKAINYVIDQKRRGVNVRVINASWGGSRGSTSLQAAITAAGQAGILFVTAAGNGGDDGVGDNIDEQPDYPASWSAGSSSIITATALDSDDRLASFSNYGRANVCVGAPGVRVLSTLVGGGYGFATGTSMAAPHIAGIAALIWSREPSLTPAQVRQRIISTGDPVHSLASKSVNPVRANAYNAISRTTPAAGNLGIGSVKATKKLLTVDGLGFVSNSSIIEVNGVALGNTKYDGGFELSNGTSTRLSVKLSKAKMNETVPRGIAVTITVFNRATGERSPGYVYVR